MLFRSEGIVLEVRDELRVVVNVTLLQRSVSVLIDRDVVSGTGN